MRSHSLVLTFAFLTAAPLAAQGTSFDEDVTPDAIFGSGNANGSFTVDRQDSVELGLRAKLREPASNIFKSNGDGTYTFNTGSGTGSAPNSEWSFEWSVNTDFDGNTGRKVGDLTYEIGMDNDPGPGTDYLVFDPISVVTIIPWDPPSPPVPFWDHSMGDNTTANGAGLEAADAPTYATYLATLNVAQNSWRPTFFQNTAPYTWDPDVAGRYDYYLAAFDGGNEIARTAIAVIVTDGMTLALEADPCQVDQDLVTGGLQIEAELWLRNPDDQPVTGYQAFLDFHEVAMTYEPTLSSYSATPFEVHIQDILTAEVVAGKLRLDGNTFGSGALGDALLATLVFTVTECDSNAINFDLTQAFNSEASDQGTPYTTALLDSGPIVADVTPPLVICPITTLTQPADAGSCTGAVVTYDPPTVTDNCDPSPALVCDPPSGSVFPVGTTTVTCTATDACGNSASSSFDVTITPTNLVEIAIELTGSKSATRCIRFVPDDCTMGTETSVDFSGSLPAAAVATVEIPCGVWTKICVKDPQHTLWGESPLIISGAKYVATATVALDGGDTDDDGDVDINDVTLYLAQFGDLASDGGCPFDGTTRDADFNNGGTVESVDYSFLVANWLRTTSCTCSIPVTGGGAGRGRTATWVRVHDAMTSRADLNADGRVDVRDVELLEEHYGLSGELSRRMRAQTGRRTGGRPAGR